MKKAFINTVRIALYFMAAWAILSLVSCIDNNSFVTEQPNASESPSDFISEDVTTIPDTLIPASSTTDEAMTKPEDVTDTEELLTPDTTAQISETAAPTQSTELTAAPEIPETTIATPETTTEVTTETTQIEETTIAEETTITPTEEQIEKINELIDFANHYDHDVAKKGIGSIHVKCPQDSKKPYEVVITANGEDYKDPTNFSFEIDKSTALKFITTMNNDLTNLPDGISPNKIDESTSAYTPQGVQFTDNSSEIINKYLSLFTNNMPEKPFYFEDKEQISDEQMDALFDYLCTVNVEFENGISVIYLTTIKYSLTIYRIEALPCKLNNAGEFEINWEFPRWGLQLNKDQFDRFIDLFNLTNCDTIIIDNATYYKVNLLEDISDTLKKQIFNLIYELLVESNKLKIQH